MPSLERYVLIGLRPACARPTADGGLEVLGYDWRSGELRSEPTLLSVIQGFTDKDVETLTKAQFEAAVAQHRAELATARPSKRP